MTATQAIRLKNATIFKGVRDNQLLSNSLVMGLDGSGDDTNVVFNIQELGNMLANIKSEHRDEQSTDEKYRAVAVTAVLSPLCPSNVPYRRPGLFYG